MDTQEAYNLWAEQYDTNVNRTRDLEGVALRNEMAGVEVEDILEIGCGTGKNTEWLATKANRITCVDLSEEMLSRARAKINFPEAEFIQADITGEWHFAKRQYDLITFSLVLEHIADVNDIFRKASLILKPGGFLYLGELHPFKQYNGSKARFDTASGVQVVQCYTHHISEFYQAGVQHGIVLEKLNEYFDEGEGSGMPRILTMVFKSSNTRRSLSC